MLISKDGYGDDTRIKIVPGSDTNLWTFTDRGLATIIPNEHSAGAESVPIKEAENKVSGSVCVSADWSWTWWEGRPRGAAPCAPVQCLCKRESIAGIHRRLITQKTKFFGFENQVFRKPCVLFGLMRAKRVCVLNNPSEVQFTLCTRHSKWNLKAQRRHILLYIPRFNTRFQRHSWKTVCLFNERDDNKKKTQRAIKYRLEQF